MLPYGSSVPPHLCDKSVSLKAVGAVQLRAWGALCAWASERMLTCLVCVQAIAADLQANGCAIDTEMGFLVVLDDLPATSVYACIEQLGDRAQQAAEVRLGWYCR